MKRICVFCGSASGNSPLYATVAQNLGAAFAQRGFKLVYGGGRVGLMGELASAVMSHGGEVIGVIPQQLSAKEIAFDAATELHIVDTMHTRKAMMADLADAFIALPGGFGTCDELFEILTWAQLGIHTKPIALLNINHFFTPLLSWLDHIVAEGFLKQPHRNMLLVNDSIDELFTALQNWQSTNAVEKWMTPEQR